jgi:hypothetical protein
MSDIFGRQEQVFGGGLTSDASWMFWGGLSNGGLGMLITNMQIQYQQPIRRIYEIGPWTSVGTDVGQPVYYVAGRPEGSLQISRITGPVAALGGFYRTYGSVCSFANSLFFVSSTGCIRTRQSGNVNPSSQVPNQFAQGQAIPFAGTGALAQGASEEDVARPDQAGSTSRWDPYLGWYMNGCVITGMSLGAQAQEMLVLENVAMMFISLRLFQSPASPGGLTWTEL